MNFLEDFRRNLSNMREGLKSIVSKLPANTELYLVGLILGIIFIVSVGWVMGIVSLIVFFLCYKFIMRVRDQTYNRVAPRGEHGSASWSSHEDFFNAGNDGTEKGLWIGGGFIRTKQSHLLTVAGSGQGKGTCLIIPNLLLEPSGSYVITDPKGENARITARFQADSGQRVFILDPWDEQKYLGADHGIPASGFNPFVFLKANPDELLDSCEQMANFLVPDKPEVKDPYWNDRARNMIKTMLLHMITALPPSEHNFWTLYKMLRYSGDSWAGLLFDMKNNPAEGGIISIAADELIGIEQAGNTMAGIRSAAQNATSSFESPQLRRSLEKNDFNPYDLTDGNCTVYIVLPERFLDTHYVWLRLVVGLCLKACNARPNKRVNFLLDEFAVMGKMKDVQRGYAFARGQNVVLWAFVQNLSQLKEIYGEDGMNAIINNSGVFQTFGVKDYYTTDYVSKMLGDTTIMTSSYSEGRDHGTTSYSKTGRRLLTPDEVETYVDIITIADGLRHPLLRHPYYEHKVQTLIRTGQISDRDLKAALKLMKDGKYPCWSDVFKQRASKRQ